MIQAGLEMGPNTPYGESRHVSLEKWVYRHFLCIICVYVFVFKVEMCVLSSGKTLLRCGEAQKQLGEAERKFAQSTNILFLNPLRNFTEAEYRSIQVNTHTHSL